MKLADGSEISCHTLLIATGVQWRSLDVPGMERLQGAGVYYGAGQAEAISCKGEDVYIVVEGELLLNRFRILRIGNANLEYEEISTGLRGTANLEEQAAPPSQ